MKEKMSIIKYAIIGIITIIVIIGTSDLIKSGDIGQTNSAYKIASDDKSRKENEEKIKLSQKKLNKPISNSIKARLKTKDFENLGFFYDPFENTSRVDISGLIDLERLTQKEIGLILSSADELAIKLGSYLTYVSKVNNIKSKHKIIDLATDFVIVEAYREFGE
ncbi:hypothetical protein LZQ00_06490 [Sphingobacterium sp. SRCM116780]|uniref:hypothetical protein n=1 Tax=Sphingobacterium sp. SRCM116780 TaxID=2907623 RepID=UPI001F2FACCD|nr:hypothetical protein [Sphingobacterium sp. SRCM116780]UIR57462.1 hypothetical protein LZQ00_06490 [Sphingobacterium sp. SRCM116780]